MWIITLKYSVFYILRPQSATVQRKMENGKHGFALSPSNCKRLNYFIWRLWPSQVPKWGAASSLLLPFCFSFSLSVCILICSLSSNMFCILRTFSTIWSPCWWLQTPPIALLILGTLLSISLNLCSMSFFFWSNSSLKPFRIGSWSVVNCSCRLLWSGGGSGDHPFRLLLHPRFLWPCLLLVHAFSAHYGIPKVEAAKEGDRWEIIFQHLI